MPVFHCIMTDGIAGIILPKPAAETETVDAESVDFLATMRRRPNGTWVKRPAPPKPTAAEIEARREAERLARREERQEARRQARDSARREGLFDHMIDGLAKIDPDFAARVAAIDVEFGGED